MKLQLYRETDFSQFFSTPDVDDGTSFRVVWSWINSANALYWNISKSVISVDHQIPLELSEGEVVGLPFTKGYITIYKINDITGRKNYYDNLIVDVVKGTAGSDYSPVVVTSTIMYMLFSYAGQAAINTMVGSYTAADDGEINKITLSCQNPPIGQNLIVEVFKNGIATGATGFLAAGDRTNFATIALSVAQGDVITAKIIQTGTTNEGSEVQCILEMVTL